ncbi:hypothetical protein D9757_002392 [Collybiopsis confluens]|uniref:Pectate lyase domain-containing protein n=1 Tax=Collybiopsis confluens TaxID=2823264 RepID=A0A8H5HYF1_9AGAR|nr:hypothetical protein D9757_002392 [Collybiopsis confluens]
MHGATGGGSATPQVPSSNAELVTWLSDSTPRVIQLNTIYDFTTFYGTSSFSACNPWSCSPNPQSILNTIAGTCNGFTTRVVTINTAGSTTNLKVGSNKTLLGKGANAGMWVQANFSFYATSESQTSILISGASNVWIDHCYFNRPGRQFLTTGFGQANGVTISNNVFDGTATWSTGCDGHHYWALILAVYANWIHTTAGRSPHSGGEASTDTLLYHFVNSTSLYWWCCFDREIDPTKLDYISDNTGHALDIGQGTYMVAEGNYFENVKTPIIGVDVNGRLYFPTTVPDANACANAGWGRYCEWNRIAGTSGTALIELNTTPFNTAMRTVAMAMVLPSVMTHYLGQFGRKLLETNPGANYRIGWVTYGQADCPLLAKRFFAEYVLVINALKDPVELDNLGIGATTAGGTKGMATLEGLVAAIELFDTFAEVKPPKWPSHVLHITASFPDDSKHPRENIFPALDNTTWENLPDELAKMTGMKRPSEPMNSNEQPPEKKQQLNISSVGSPPRPQAPLGTLSGAGTAPSTPPVPPQPQLGRPEVSGGSAQPTVSQNGPNLVNAPNLSNVPQLPFPVPAPNSQQKYPWPGLGVSLTPAELLQRYRQLEDQRKKIEAVFELATKELKDLKEEAESKGENRDAQIAMALRKVEAMRAEIVKREPMWNKFRAIGNGYFTLLKRMQLAGAATASGGQSSNGSSGSIPNVAPAMHVQPSSSGDSTASDPTSSSNVNISTISSPSGAIRATTSASTASGSSPLASVAKPSPKPSPSLTTTMKQSPKPSPKLSNKPNIPHSTPKLSPKPSPLKPSPVRNAAAANVPNSTATGYAAGPGATSTASGAPVNIGMSPEVALQMQKLLERGGQHAKDMAKGQGSPSSGPASTSGMPLPHSQGQPSGSGHVPDTGNLSGGGMGNISGVGQPGQQSAGGHLEPPAQSNSGPLSTLQNGGSGNIPAWTGRIFLPGETAGKRNDIRIFVTANSVNTAECRAHTWPQEMTLSFTSHATVNHAEFESWARKTRPVVCTMKAFVRLLPPGAASANPQAQMTINQMNIGNEQLFQGFSSMVQFSKHYIVSAWTIPNSGPTNNVVFAFQPPHGLIGAFFPVSGIPEMPKPLPGLSGVPTPGMSNLSSLNTSASNPTGSPSTIAELLQAWNVPLEVANKILIMPPPAQAQAVKALLARIKQGQQGLGMAGRPGSGPLPGAGVNITNAAAAMAMRMAQQQSGTSGNGPGGVGMPPGLQTLQGMQGPQRPGGQFGHPMDGNQHQGNNSNLHPNMANLVSGMRADLGNTGNLGSLGGMGGMNAASLGGMGGGIRGLTPQQLQQFRLQARGAFGGGSLGQGGGSVG